MSNKSPYNSPFRSKYLSPSSTIQQGLSFFLKPSKFNVFIIIVDSPSKIKIKLLSEKWSNLENGIEKEKNERRGLLDDKLRQCEERITKERSSDDSKFKVKKKNGDSIFNLY